MLTKMSEMELDMIQASKRNWKILLSFFCLLVGLIGIVGVVYANESKCRAFPKAIAVDRGIFTCDFDRSSGTLTCWSHRNPDGVGASWILESHSFQYSDAETFIREAVIGVPQAQSVKIVFQLTTGDEAITQTTSFEYEGNRLLSVSQESADGSPFVTSYKKWDKQQRPIAGVSDRAACSGAGSTIGIYRNVPVRITYDDRKRLRTVERFFNQGREIRIGGSIKCRAMVEKTVESYDKILTGGRPVGEMIEVCSE
jgi:hypothetical protein